jgi:hypothetical protein
VYFDQRPHSLKACLYNDGAWQQFQTLMKKGSLCKDRVAVATKCVPIMPRRSKGHELIGFSTTLQSENSDHYWYAVLADCYLEEYDAHPPRVHFEVKFLNAGGHLPADEDGLHTIHLILFFILSAFGIYALSLMHKQFMTLGQIHLSAILLTVAYVLQCGSIFFELCHLIRYEADGKGLRWRHTVFALDFLSETWQQLSELIISFLLISIGFGWTLQSPQTVVATAGIGGGGTGGEYQSDPSKDRRSFGGASVHDMQSTFRGALQRPGEFLKKPSVSTVTFIMVAFFQFTLTWCGRLYEDDFNR